MLEDNKSNLLEKYKQIILQGGCLCKRPIYGYRIENVIMPSGQTLRKLVPDEYQKSIVQLMYNKYASGLSIPDICKILPKNAEKKDKDDKWAYQREYNWIKTLLFDEERRLRMLGNAVCSNLASHKLDRAEWIIQPNAHEPIITQEMCDAVDRAKADKKYTDNDPQIISLSEAAKLLGIKGRCVYPLISRGVLCREKTGVTRESVEAEVRKRKLRSENYTIADAARELNISYATVKNDGDIGRFVLIDGYIPKDSYEKYIAWRKSLPSNGRMIAHKRTSTIVAAGEYLGVSRGMVQYALREGFIFCNPDGKINEESLAKYKKLRSTEGLTRLRKLIVKHARYGYYDDLLRISLYLDSSRKISTARETVQAAGIACGKIASDANYFRIYGKEAEKLLEMLELTTADLKSNDYLARIAAVVEGENIKITKSWAKTRNNAPSEEIYLLNITDFLCKVKEYPLWQVADSLPFDIGNNFDKTFAALEDAGYNVLRYDKVRNAQEEVKADSFDLTDPQIAYCAGLLASAQYSHPTQKFYVNISGEKDSLKFFADTIGVEETYAKNGRSEYLRPGDARSRLLIERLAKESGNDLLKGKSEKSAPLVPLHKASFIAGYIDGSSYAGTGKFANGKARTWISISGSRDMLTYIAEALSEETGVPVRQPRLAAARESIKISVIEYTSTGAAAIAEWLLSESIFLSEKNKTIYKKIIDVI